MGVEKRKVRRRHVLQPALIIDDNGAVVGPCTMLDVSAGGAKLMLSTELTLPPTFVILLSKYSGALKRHCVVAWQKGRQVGIRFPECVAQG
jgi:hypothetical protein